MPDAARARAELVDDRLPIPFVRYRVEDLGRHVEFYLSRHDAGTQERPLVAIIQGSGCDSLFRQGPGGGIFGGRQNILRNVVGDGAVVLAVEKPGVRFLDRSRAPGRASRCGEHFLREHTLERWGSAVNAAIRAATAMPGIDTSRNAVVGHSEGAVTAAYVASQNAEIAAVGLLSAPGGSQLFDLIGVARARRRREGRSEAEAQRQVEKVLSTFRRIQTDKDSVERFAWGHPYRRWDSFLRHSTAELVSRSAAAVYIVHGTRDEVVPVESADYLATELLRRGRPHVTVRYLADAGHNLVRPEDPSDADAHEQVLRGFAEWWLARRDERV